MTSTLTDRKWSSLLTERLTSDGWRLCPVTPRGAKRMYFQLVEDLVLMSSVETSRFESGSFTSSLYLALHSAGRWEGAILHAMHIAESAASSIRSSITSMACRQPYLRSSVTCGGAASPRKASTAWLGQSMIAIRDSWHSLTYSRAFGVPGLFSATATRSVLSSTMPCPAKDLCCQSV